MGSAPSKPATAARAYSEKAEPEPEPEPVPSPSARADLPVGPRSSPGITHAALRDWDAAALSLPTSQLAHLTLHNAALPSSLHSRTAEVANTHVYSHAVPFECKPVTNQRSSGRCWLFATTNVIRNALAPRLGLDEFELSQSYLSFWDKLEKANFYLENMIQLANQGVGLDDRVVSFLNTDPTNDGGQWDMVANLLAKYGVVPKAVYPESYNSSNSAKINWLVRVKLREYALELRDIHARLSSDPALAHLGASERSAAILSSQRARKDAQMAEVYRMLAIALGPPPRPDAEFTFSYRDKDAKFRSVTSTPRDFLRPFSYHTRCSLVHDPRHEAGRLISIARLGNVFDAPPVRYVNTSTAVMRDAVVASIKAGQPVFFGCDVGQFSDTPSGIMDPALLAPGYELAFNLSLGMTKAQRIQTGETAMTHAMVITAVHMENDKVVRYRVENSWGDTAGEKGYMVMTDRWFQEFNFQVVVDKQFMPKQLWDLFERGVDQHTIILPPYDPLGALA